MTEILYFLPWMRRGLGLKLSEPDTGQTDLPRSAPVGAYVDLDGERAEASISLRPADHVVGIDASQIIRRYPGPSVGDAEYGYFPLVEFSAPDLPWVVTPVAPNQADGRLRPWVVLVCVEESKAGLIASAAGQPARLIVPSDQLPDLAESYAWAHVQSAVPFGDAVAALADQPGAVIARLVCPRRLAPDTAYRAAIVAAFARDGDLLVPAWTVGGGDANLLVYDTWTFATGQASSFEELCLRLGPVADPTFQLGLKTMDLTDLGSVDPWPSVSNRVTVDYTGGLWDADLTPKKLGPQRARDFEDAVSELLNQGGIQLELDPDATDPVVTPPFVGAYAAGQDRVPEDYWLHDLNLDPNRRAAAGLGAELVRIHQERFMARAWQQAGQVRETNRQLSFTRLQSEIGRTVKARIDRLDALDRVSLLRPQLSFVRDADGAAPRSLLHSSTVPDALLCPAYHRTVRPSGVVSTAAARRAVENPSFHSAIGDTFGSFRIRDQLRFGVPAIPAGVAFADIRRSGRDGGGGEPPDIEPPPDDDGPLPTTPSKLTGQPVVLGSAGTLDLADVASLATAGVRPMDAARQRIEARIPALSSVFRDRDVGDDELPSRVLIGPTIDEALVWSLVDMSPELLLPGVQQFPNNAVRVVETNTSFVASFLAGANHEMTRELLWREYPAELGSTTFRRFWDRPDRTATDIDLMAGWGEKEELVDLGAGGGDSVVVLIRGDLIRHYPTVRVLLAEYEEGPETMPSFGGWIPPDIRFFAFDVPDADAVTREGTKWQVVLEEQLTEPRFGLDTIVEGADPPPLLTWNDLSWEHLTGQESSAHLVIGGEGGIGPEYRPPDGATWALNAAHMARITYQAPYRHSMPVKVLIGPSS